MGPAQHINIGPEEEFVVIGTFFVVLRLSYLLSYSNKDCVRKHLTALTGKVGQVDHSKKKYQTKKRFNWSHYEIFWEISCFQKI